MEEAGPPPVSICGSPLEGSPLSPQAERPAAHASRQHGDAPCSAEDGTARPPLEHCEGCVGGLWASALASASGPPHHSDDRWGRRLDDPASRRTVPYEDLQNAAAQVLLAVLTVPWTPPSPKWCPCGSHGRCARGHSQRRRWFCSTPGAFILHVRCWRCFAVACKRVSPRGWPRTAQQCAPQKATGRRHFPFDVLSRECACGIGAGTPGLQYCPHECGWVPPSPHWMRGDCRGRAGLQRCRWCSCTWRACTERALRSSFSVRGLLWLGLAALAFTGSKLLGLCMASARKMHRAYG